MPIISSIRENFHRLFRGRNAGYWFVAPAVLFLLAFTAYPLLRAVIMSLTEVSSKGVIGSWNGLENWLRIFQDENFTSSILRSLRFAIMGVVGSLSIGVVLAMLISMKWLPSSVSNFIRGLAILPWLFATSVAALMWGLMMHRDGILNAIITGFKLSERPVMFVGNPKLALASLAGIYVWRVTPFIMLMVLAALKSIPVELYEAGYVDGASRWQAFWRITFPLILPLLLTLVILCFVWGIGQFDLIRIITGGGPINSTEVVSYYIYRVGFLTVNWSYGSAIGVAVFIVNLLFAILYMYLYRRARPWQ